MTVRIREARADERDLLEALQRRASLANEEHRAALLANPDAIQLPAEHLDRGDVFVAEEDGEVRGFAVLIVEPDCAELDGLFVEPAHWRQGIGAALVKEAVPRARRVGLALGVIANPAAREFYERCGFTLEGEVPTRFGKALRMTR